MENKHQFRARVRNINNEYLEDYRDNHDLADIGEALDKILEEHKEFYNKHWNLQYISTTVAQTVQQEMKRDIKN